MSTLRVEVPSDTAYLRTIRAIVRAYCREVDKTDDVLVRGLLVAVTEISNNAIAAQKRLGTEAPITISCSLHEGQPRVAILDRGGGFDTEVLETVLSGHRVDEGAGLGLGLQLSRALVSDLSIDSSDAQTRVAVTMAHEL